MTCPICNRVMCDHSPMERGQSNEELMQDMQNDFDRFSQADKAPSRKTGGDLESEIEKQVRVYESEKEKVAQALGENYRAAGCVRIKSPSANRKEKEDGLELSYDLVGRKTNWHLDKIVQSWSLYDMTQLRYDSSYKPDPSHVDFGGNIAEYVYSPAEAVEIGTKILEGEHRGPLENPALKNLGREIAETIGIHMVALGRYATAKK